MAFIQIRPILLANICLGTDSTCTNSLIILADTPMKNVTEPDPILCVKCKQLCLLGITAECCQAMTVDYIWWIGLNLFLTNGSLMRLFWGHTTDGRILSADCNTSMAFVPPSRPAFQSLAALEEVSGWFSAVRFW